jgi:hypothetical protein
MYRDEFIAWRQSGWSGDMLDQLENRQTARRQRPYHLR